MPQIRIAADWSYVTPQTTVDYPAGTWTVPEEVAAAYDLFINPPPPEDEATEQEPVNGETEEVTDGSGDPETGAQGPAGEVEIQPRGRRARTGD